MSRIVSRNLKTVRLSVAKLEPFNCNGTLIGSTDTSLSFGLLPERYRRAIVQDRDMLRELPDNTSWFVVYSYGTPIAWLAGDVWVVPNVKYSPTTTRHLAATGLPTQRWGI